MEHQLEEIRDQQKDSWNKFSGGWKKWDSMMMDFLHPFGEEIIRKIAPKDPDVVLDIAAGTGEPGLTIASMLKTGKVVISDLSDDMLSIAREHAASRSIHNIETIACDVCELPFDDHTFDAISCRFGMMFFPDMLVAAKEMVRVLKPGGRLATVVWRGPDENLWIDIIGQTINRNMQLQPPPPGAPGIFRCEESGLVSELLLQAGLKEVSEKEIAGKMNYGTTQMYWDMLTEVAAPVVSALTKADPEMREKIQQEIFQLLSEMYPDGNVVFDSSAWVISGVK